EKSQARRSGRSCDGRLTGVRRRREILLAEIRHRDVELPDEAGGGEVGGDLAAERPRHKRPGDIAAEAVARRLAYARAAGLAPHQPAHRLLALGNDLPGDADPAAADGQGAVFGSVGGELVKGETEIVDRLRFHGQMRAFDLQSFVVADKGRWVAVGELTDGAAAPVLLAEKPLRFRT